jgi:hypothetical protein
MTAALLRVAALSLVLALASASAGASLARPPVAITASPSHVDLAGSARATVRVTNAGASRVVLDARQAGFALDLRGRPRVVSATPRSAAGWLSFRPRRLVLSAGASGSVTIASKVPATAEPGDHDALVLLMTRRGTADGLAVRVRLGVVVVVRAPGQIVRRVRARDLRVVRRGRARTLELSLVNGGNVTESFSRTGAVVSLDRGGRRLVRLRAEARDLRPRTRGVLEFHYRGRISGQVLARVDLVSDSGQVIRRDYRLRL